MALQIPVSYVSAGVDIDSATWSMRKLATAIGRLWWPGEVSFSVFSAGGAVGARWQVKAADEQDLQQVADDLTAVIAAVAPWMGLGAPQEYIGDSEPPTYSFRPGPLAPTSIVTKVAAAWRLAATDGSAWQLQIVLAGGLHLPDADDGAALTAWAEAPTLQASVALYGSGRRADLMAALIADDTRHGQTLIAEPTRLDREVPVVEFSTDLIGHLLSLPARIPGSFDSRPIGTAEDLFQQISATPSPHLLLLGGTGQGKSSLLVHLADEALKKGEPVVCVDVHDGEFAAQVDARARLHGVTPKVIDLGDHAAGLGFSLQLTKPPPGVAAGRWADDLYDIIRDVLWGSMSDDYFGPVGKRALTLCLNALIRDPAGPLPLTRLPELLDPTHPEFRGALLRRIGDPELTRAFVSEVMPMLTGKDAGHSAIWLISKLEPLIGNAAVREVIGGSDDTVHLEHAVLHGRSIMLLVPSAHLVVCL